MLGAELRDFEGEIRSVNHILAHSVHLVAEYEGIFASRLMFELFQLEGAHSLLYADNGVTLGTQPADSLKGIVKMLPGNGILGSEG